MSAQAGMTSRALYEASAHAALARYHVNLTEVPRKVAYNTLVDDLLKAADTYALHVLDARVRDQMAASLAASRRATLDQARSEACVAAGKAAKRRTA